MIQPEALKKRERLQWSTGSGVDVWDLFGACLAGDLPTVKRLVDKDPSLVRSQHAYRTPIHFAVRENRIDVVTFLLERGADPFGLAVSDSLLEICRDRGYGDLAHLLEATFAATRNASPGERPSPRRSASTTCGSCGASWTPHPGCCTPVTSGRTSRSTGR